MPSKKLGQRIHAKRRAAERFGVTLNRDDLRALVKLIQSGKAKFVTRQSHRITLFEVPIGESQAIAVYDKARQTIVTFLPEEWSKD